MGYPVEKPIEEHNPPEKKSSHWFKNWKIILAIIIIFIGLILLTMSIYQRTHFNSNITINGIEVSGLTAGQTLEKLQTSLLSNNIYVGDHLILVGNETKMNFTEKDLTEIKNTLRDQWTFFPSSEEKTYYLLPSDKDLYRSEVLRNELELELFSLNQSLQAPIDARAHIENGEVVISESVDGEHFDVDSLLEDFDKQEYISDVFLKPVYLHPIKDDSQVVQDQVKRLQDFLEHTIEYQIQDQVYSLEANQLIVDASLSENLNVLIHSDLIVEKIAEINDSQSTLGKDFTFNTHSGSVITVKGQGYGWALNAENEASMIKEAFQNGEKTISASNIYGNGWSGEGYGYETLSNFGIGSTYAEVSIAAQRMWIYKEGQLVLTTNVVTGNRSTQQDTLKGVWYILYKRTPYTLTGDDYSTEVDYWAPFTNSGQGFHDASWRTNWSGNAYHNAGSNGCVNVPPDVMKKVYHYLNVYDPVVIY
ncbi:L,D-transpeptidase family protein [Halalkalibacter akibai]|uniref:ErfK/YbiS/YcfS/YnhG family protein n=1 Tax=Halalkalibacter akibai (strain ATCC 43226 / DSM 21942 / CIP 109018 / JCM 9157 / 1139) TaxID=1236973 RepID=W4QQW1_HALA3|nr:L,D-transpeptidase family protein [Halalkalibacter akibai]GAE34456.1 ErfK/YbiS/YcfS/YnhG family protein [Halalkalibacter akibai JCM 9157]